jgi:hypothetical protein
MMGVVIGSPTKFSPVGIRLFEGSFVTGISFFVKQMGVEL